MWRFILPVGVFAALIVVFMMTLGRDKETSPSPLIGKTAPTFEIATLEDPNVTVGTQQFAGKAFLLNVWATWCVGCRQEHDVLLEISRRGQVPILGLNWKDERDLAQRWLRELGNPYVANAFDNEGRIAIDWGVYGAPETFLIDASGRVVHKLIGPMTMQIWEREFVPLLAGATGASRE
jgi:cytochrome c biogenesis protein CcmG/thiol:disulfide interchange protein DsbE